MFASIDYIRDQIRRGMEAGRPTERRDALERALDGLERVDALLREQEACIDALGDGIADVLADDLEEIAAPFPAFDAGEYYDVATNDLVCVGPHGETWTLDELLAREG